MGELRICNTAGCDLPIIARGLCTKHYQRRRRDLARRTAEYPPVVVDCPEDLEPLVAQLVENDARPIFTLLWRAIGNWHLQGTDVAS